MPAGGATGGGLPAGGGAGPTGGASTTGGATGDGGATITSFAVVTNRYDNARSGANTAETQLTTSNVTAAHFGLLFSRPMITGHVFGQPVYAGGISVSGVKHNVVYVVTEHNMIYAFDADSAAASAPLWSRSLGTALPLSAAGYSPGCSDMQTEVGITSTPVISVADNVIYVVAKTISNQQLHALDLGTGADVAGSPSTIGAGPMTFDPRIHLNRTGLLLLNGTLYIGYGSHCDNGGYHGWILGYDAKSLQLQSVFNSTPSGNQGAIWQSGVGLTSDGKDIWTAVGNGSTNGENAGFSVLRLTPAAGTLKLSVTARYQGPSDGDNDLQSGVALLGSTGQVAAGNKGGNIFQLGQSDLSLKQNLHPAGSANSFAFWNGSAGPMLFVWPEGGGLHAYQVGAGTLTDKGSNSEQKPGHPGGEFTVSSNGAMPGTGIVWATMPVVGDAWHGVATGALYAFDASDVTKASLWNSNLNAQDKLGSFAKFNPPIVANGKVYVATFSEALRVYGLK
jgi:PQQ-like domain